METNITLLQTLIGMSSNKIAGNQSKQGGVCQNLLEALTGDEKSFLSTLNGLEKEGFNLDGLVGLLKDNGTVLENDDVLGELINTVIASISEETDTGLSADDELIKKSSVLHLQSDMPVKTTGNIITEILQEKHPGKTLSESELKSDLVIKNETSPINDVVSKNAINHGKMMENIPANAEKIAPIVNTTDNGLKSAANKKTIVDADLRNRNEFGKPLISDDASQDKTMLAKTAATQTGFQEAAKEGLSDDHGVNKTAAEISGIGADGNKKSVNQTVDLLTKDANRATGIPISGAAEKDVKSFSKQTPESEPMVKDGSKENISKTPHLMDRIKPSSMQEGQKINNTIELSEKPIEKEVFPEINKRDSAENEKVRFQENASDKSETYTKQPMDPVAGADRTTKSVSPDSSKAVLKSILKSEPSDEISTPSERLKEDKNIKTHKSVEKVTRFQEVKQMPNTVETVIAGNDLVKASIDDKNAVKSAIHVQRMTQDKIVRIETGGGEESLLNSNQNHAEKTFETTTISREPTTAQKSFHADVLSQVIEKVALNIKSGQTSVNISLKPEALGQLKMQISTENNHVLVRIITELPMVKEIIESNLNTLRTELSNQGLEIEKFDVSVDQGFQQNDRAQEKASLMKMKNDLDMDSTDNTDVDGQLKQPPMRRNPSNENVIDYFA